MKNMVRTFVVVIALTGAVASTQTPAIASARTITASTSLKAMPVPTCEPGGKNDPCPCNICSLGK